MKNVHIKQDAEWLTISINMSESFGPSKSGKTIIVASTEGNVKLNGGNYPKGLTLGLNLYKDRG